MKYFEMVFYLNKDTSPKMDEVLVDLLDFTIGNKRCVYEHISTRDKKRMSPLLKAKISSEPLSSEIDVNYRNEIIRELLWRLVTGTKYIDDSLHFHPDEMVKEWMLYLQFGLEEDYYSSGKYPSNLPEGWTSIDPDEEKHRLFLSEKEKIYHNKLLKRLELRPTKNSSYGVIEDGSGKYQLILYQCFGKLYFICALGKDMTLGTEDDIEPPYMPEIFSFPQDVKIMLRKMKGIPKKQEKTEKVLEEKDVPIH
jgi:hypothetical protein